MSQSPVYHSLSTFVETSMMCISTNSEGKDDDSRQDEEKNVNSTLHVRFLSSKLIESNQTIRDEIYKVHYAKKNASGQHERWDKVRRSLQAKAVAHFAL